MSKFLNNMIKGKIRGVRNPTFSEYSIAETSCQNKEFSVKKCCHFDSQNPSFHSKKASRENGPPLGVSYVFFADHSWIT